MPIKQHHYHDIYMYLFTAGSDAQMGIERSGKTVKYFRNRRIQFGVLADAFVV